MNGKLISADRLIQFVENWGKHHGREEAADSFLYAIHNAPAVDVVEVDTVAEMLYRAIGDRYACDVNGNDEWLSEVCELQEQCPHPKDILGCWKQFVKHYRSEKMGYLEGE